MKGYLIMNRWDKYEKIGKALALVGFILSIIALYLMQNNIYTPTSIILLVLGLLIALLASYYVGKSKTFVINFLFNFSNLKSRSDSLRKAIGFGAVILMLNVLLWYRFQKPISGFVRLILAPIFVTFIVYFCLEYYRKKK